MGLHSYGVMGVDWEERVDFDRLRDERLARIKRLLAESDLGALLCFDMTNIRYITATHIGTWAMDKLIRFCLLPQGDEPIMWDFGSAARHHELYCPWLGEGRSRAGISTLRGAMSPQSGRAEDVAAKIRIELEQRGLLGEPVGVDASSRRSCSRSSARASGRRRPAADAAGARDQDPGRDHAARHRLHDGRRRLRGALPRRCAPGIRENECVALVNKVLYEMGSEHVEGVNAISGERCSPHPHVFTDRVLRPGRPGLLRHPPLLHGLPHLLLPHVRGRQRLAGAGRRLQALPRLPRRRDRDDPPRRHHRRGRSVWPRAQEFGFPDEEAAFALQFGHGVGLSIWEKPIFWRLVSLEHPEVIEEGMVFALETFWPSSDGWSAARIEEQLVVTADGCEVITRFPAEDL